MLKLKAGPMRNHDYTTLFKLEHMLKDVRLCLEEGQALGVPFPSAAYAREILSASMGRGHADDDFAALIERARRAGGVRAVATRGPAAPAPVGRDDLARRGAAPTGDQYQFAATPIRCP